MVCATQITACLLGLLLCCLRAAQGACTSYSVSIEYGRNSFSYGAGYTPPAGCPAANITVARLYLQGACAATRNNDFGDKVPDCSKDAGTVTDGSAATCENVFAKGPSNAFVNFASLARGDWFDYGTVCTTAEEGFFFFNSDCDAVDSQTVTFETSPYGSNLCWNGHTVSRGAVAGGAIAVFFFLFFVILVTLYFMRHNQSQQSVPLASTIHLQPYPQGPPPPYPGTSQAQSSSSYPQSSSFLPYDDKPVTGIPVGSYGGPRV